MTENTDAPGAIQAIFATLEEAWNRRDAAAFAAVFAEDADFTNVLGMRAKGRAAIEQNHALIFRTLFKDSRLETGAPRIVPIGPDVVAADIEWQMTGARDPEGHEVLRRCGLMDAVARRDANGWSIVVFHNAELPPPEGMRSFNGLSREWQASA